VLRRIFVAGLVLAPVSIAIHYLTPIGATAEFVVSAAALVPLAWLIGEATEHAAEHTGPGIGGFLNATFGNAPELIIAVLAIDRGLVEVVRGSLTGSVIGNLLLVLGASLLAGGHGRIDRPSAMLSLALITVALLLFLITAIPGWEGDPNRHALQIASLPVACVLLVLYVIATGLSLRRHAVRHSPEAEPVSGWSLRRALLVLGAATVVTALVAEILVGSIEEFAERVGLTDFFVAAVIVAIVGNAAEHGGAVLVAKRGKIELASEIATSSAAQVALFVIPAVVIISWAIEPLALSFRPVELIALAGALVVTAAVLAHGRSSHLRGAVLVAAYGVVATMFYFAGDR